MTQAYTRPGSTNVDYNAVTGDSVTGAAQKLDNAIADIYGAIQDATTLVKGVVMLGSTSGKAQEGNANLGAISGLTSAADALPYFTGSGTAAVTTLTSAGRALLDDASASNQRTTLGLGTAAVLDVGTSASNVVQLDGSARLPAVDGSQLTGLPASHTRLHTMTSALDHSASNWKVFYSDGSGQVQELTLGAANTVLTSAGATSAPTFSAPAASSEWTEITASKTTASNSANVAFTGLDGTAYDYRVDLSVVKPGTTGATLRLETGYGAGPTWRASDYSVAVVGLDQGGSATNFSSSDAAIGVLTPALATASGDHVDGDLHFKWDGVDTVTSFGNLVVAAPNGGVPTIKVQSVGLINYTNPPTALRFTMSSGNIASGVFRLFRRAK